MKVSSITILTVLTALTAIAAPILFAIYIARDQAIAAEREHMQAYARDVLRRSDATADQIAAGINKLTASSGGAPCSRRQLALMREIDLASSYLQAIGHVSANRMVCSSLGLHDPGLALGPVDMQTSNGVKLRYNVQFPFAPETDFVVVEKDGYAAILNKTLPIDATTDVPDVSLATYMTDNGHILTARGPVRPEWINELHDQHDMSFLDDGHLVAIVKSERYKTGAIAALPVTYLDQRSHRAALWIVPIGLLAGLVLALSVLYLARLQQSMPTALRGALRRNELHLVYQPVVDLRSGQWVGAEALLRWRTPAGTTVPPDLFIPVAESTGLIQRITQRVLEIVARDASELFRQYPQFHVAINLAAADLQDLRTVELLRQLYRDTGAGPASLVVEATERGFLTDLLASAIVQQIRASGIRTSIDDFGTGYSSLSYLEKLELDFLKIDKSFVETINTDAPTSHVVLHIIELAKDLQLEMVAEGVETEAQAQFLRSHGVHYAQGWLFARPMTLAELLSQLAQQSAAAGQQAQAGRGN